jgi:quinolinate synthase
MPSPESTELITEIERLKKERGALILAHNYQNDEIQDIADIVGDSLALSRAASNAQSGVIVFCGVHFMAESAAILSPEKTVLLPDETAGCPMADMADAEEVLRWRKSYPNAVVVSYVNSTAAVKALSDYCCTSANAVKLVRGIPENEIIFLPDQNLGRYVAGQVPEKTIHIWPGYCITHHRVKPDEILEAKALHPDALVLVHPECRTEILKLADFVGSTSQIIDYAKTSASSKFIIGTEMGILHCLKNQNPDKLFYLATPGLVCPNMKRITLPKVLAALKNMAPVITVAPEIRIKAKAALDRMLQYVN